MTNRKYLHRMAYRMDELAAGKQDRRPCRVDCLATGKQDRWLCRRDSLASGKQDRRALQDGWLGCR